MSISSTLTNLMNAVRSATGESNKMNIDDAIKLLLNITPFDKVGGELKPSYQLCTQKEGA